jgi:predicted acylesterase/phospholipase RssA
MALKADAVFEGGGVKGIGLVGTVYEIENAGYEFENLAGTSAGAIVASLLAVGYKSEEIKRELERLNYNDFKDEGLLDKLGVIGIGIPTVIKINGIGKEVKTTDFDITQDESHELFENGVEVARKFLEKCDFNQWKKTYTGNI